MSRARRAAPGEDALHLGVRLTRVGNKVRGELRMMDGPGDGDTRRVDGESCDAVVEVLSLTAALALIAQPQHATPPPPAPPPRTPPPPPRSRHRILDDAFPRKRPQAAGTATRARGAEAARAARTRENAGDCRAPARAARTCRAPGFRSVCKLLLRTSTSSPIRSTWAAGSACASNATRTGAGALRRPHLSLCAERSPAEPRGHLPSLDGDAVTGCPPSAWAGS